MEKHEKAVKRFGVRYGRTVKRKLGAIEAQQRGSHRCPFCRYVKVKRKAAGIWECSKCGITYASRAYASTPFPTVRTEESEE